jgi:hypothetical protein
MELMRLGGHDFHSRRDLHPSNRLFGRCALMAGEDMRLCP